MKKTSYTPGPWRCHCAGIGENETIFAGSEYIAHDILPANARLIAAAPRMIRALQLLAGNGISENEDGLTVFSGNIADFNEGMALANEIINELE
jgi:hypothetical protein